MNKQIAAASFIGVAILGAACEKREEPDARLPAPTSSSTATVGSGTENLDHWLGKWNGPEGTFVVVSMAPTGYTIEIQSLDSAAEFEAKAIDGTLVFERGGKTETLRATDGKATGMKWLQDKTECLTIAPGEGFCRK